MRSAEFAVPVATPCATTLAAPFATGSGRPLPLWRASQIDHRSAAHGSVHPSGHSALDNELPGGGWPAAGLTELLLPAPGCGELQLLAPMLAHASRRGLLLWITPPCTPYAPALVALGLATDRLVVVTPAGPSAAALPAHAADAAWAAEQALRSGTLSTVLWWQGPARVPMPPATLRRLHLAAVEGRTPLFALRPAAVRRQSSPAPLRLALEAAAPHQLAVEVFKRRGPPMAAPLVLTLPGPVPWPARAGWRRAQRTPLPQEQQQQTTTQEDAVVCPEPGRVAA